MILVIVERLAGSYFVKVGEGVCLAMVMRLVEETETHVLVRLLLLLLLGGLGGGLGGTTGGSGTTSRGGGARATGGNGGKLLGAGRDQLERVSVACCN